MEVKIALVTGGNRGIGLEICKQLAARKYLVYMGARDMAQAQEAMQKVKGKVEAIGLDVTDTHSIKKAAMLIKKKHGKLDVLFNNAGISMGAKGVLDTTMNEFKQVMNTNFYGPLRMSKVFFKLLSESEDGRIINVSSGMGSLADLNGKYAAYRLSKSNLNALTIMLSKEFTHMVKVFAMCPGWVRTDMGGRSAIRTVSEGAETAIWLATDEMVRGGRFYRDKKEIDW